MRGSPCLPLVHFRADRVIGRPVFLPARREFELAIMEQGRTEYMVDGT
jgi:hypothetical protein